MLLDREHGACRLLGLPCHHPPQVPSSLEDDQVVSRASNTGLAPMHCSPWAATRWRQCVACQAQLHGTRALQSSRGPCAWPWPLPTLHQVLLSDILPTAWHSCELGEVGPGDRVAIWGAGPGKGAGWRLKLWW